MKQLCTILALITLLSIKSHSLRVLYTCQKCLTLNCSSSFCYNLDGAGFSNFQICATDPCTPGSEYEQHGSQCTINSNQVLCQSKCCISPTRQSYENRRCTDGLDYGSKYCDGELSIAAVGGIIFGSIAGFVLITIGICLIVNKIKSKKEEQNKESKILKRQSSRLKKSKSKVKQKLLDNSKSSDHAHIIQIKLGSDKSHENSKYSKNHQSEVKLKRNDNFI